MACNFTLQRFNEGGGRGGFHLALSDTRIIVSSEISRKCDRWIKYILILHKQPGREFMQIGVQIQPTISSLQL